MTREATSPAACDEVRELLPEHLLGTLDESDEAAVRRHLRGCGGCRNELAMLGEGLATFSRAAHQADPPPELRDRVLGALADERADKEQPVADVVDLRERRRPWRWAAAAAAVVVLAGTLTWAVSASSSASRLREKAVAYQRFLDSLGGREVRVASLHGAGGRQVEGSAILYDSDVGQSWVLVLVRSPGATGTARVVLRSPADRIVMHETEFGAEGSTDAWLVTHNDISKYNRVAVYDGKGNLLATGRVEQS
jgi:hypothetical protein